MKNLLSKTALAALALCGVMAAAAPALAAVFYDDYGRPYYFNAWGQRVFYDTGYNGTTVYGPASTTTYRYYYPDTTNTTVTRTTYVEQPAPANTCRENDRTVRIGGEIRTEHYTECLSNGMWVEQY